METAAKRYNYCLDFFKGIACICVVLMHCEFPGRTGIVVQAMTRFCVPFFFMVSGYYCYKEDSNGNQIMIPIGKKVKHVAMITLYASLFSLLFIGIRSLLVHNVNWHIGPSRVLNFLVFNQPFIIFGQYWFLFALIYVYVVYRLIMKWGGAEAGYILAACMFVLYVLLAQVAWLSGYHVPNMIYRNFMVEGFAFLMLGHFIHQYQDRLKIKNEILLIIIFASTFLCIVERYMIGRDFGVNIMTLPQVFCMFLYAVNNLDSHAGKMQEIGKKYSMLVYVTHPFVWHSLEGVYSFFGIRDNIVALYVLPILVVFGSLLASWCCHCIMEWIERKRIQVA